MISVWLVAKLTATLSPLAPLVRVKLPVKSILLPTLSTPDAVFVQADFFQATLHATLHARLREGQQLAIVCHAVAVRVASHAKLGEHRVGRVDLAVLIQIVTRQRGEAVFAG